jgi:hypothetical protein
MNTGKDPLQELILLLSKDEKREVRHRLNGNEYAKSSFLKMYEVFENVKTQTDEKKIRQKLYRHIAEESYSSIKSQLKEKVLGVLRDTSLKSSRSKIHLWLDYVELLVNKTMYKEAQRYIEKVKEEALNINDTSYYLIANRWSGFILQHLFSGNEYFESLKQYREETLQLAERYYNTILIGHYYTSVTETYLKQVCPRDPDTTQIISQFKQHPVFQLEPDSQSMDYYTCAYLCMAKGYVYTMNADYEQAYQYHQILWNMVKNDWSNKLINKRQEAIYALHNYTDAVCKLPQKQFEFIEALTLLRQLAANELKDDFYSQCFYQLYLVIYKINYEQNHITPTHIQQLLSLYRSKRIHRFEEMKMNMEVALFLSYYIIKDYDHSLEYIQKIINEAKKRKRRIEVATLTELFHIMLLYLKVISKDNHYPNVKYFKTAVTSFYNKKRRQKGDYRLELLFARYFQRVFRIDLVSTKRKHLKELEKLKQQIDLLLEENSIFSRFMKALFSMDLWFDRCREQLRH